MRTFAVLLAASCLAWSSPRHAFADPDEKAVQRAMENQRKAVEAEMRRQAEFEKKMMQNQQKAMQEQAKAEQKYMEMQQRAMHEQQQKMMQNQQKATQHQQGTTQQAQANPPHVTTTATATPVYHATRPYYGHQSSGHYNHRTTYQNRRTTSSQVDPQTLALQRLKKSLDSVQMGSTVTSNHKTAIKKALMGVVQVPKVPTIASLTTLSGHLANGLANRTSSGAQTGPMALTLRGALNSTEMANSDLTEIMNEHRTALRASKFRPTEVTSVMESLKTVANQERAHR